MDDDRAPRNAAGPAGEATDARRFALAVWPATPAGRWRAELTLGGAAPMRFERAFDLVVYLTELGGPASLPSSGLR